MLDLTVCIIAKNEEDQLPRCLASIKSVADQIVVVDTGSTDRTADIAKEWGARVHHFPWRDDFSAARNYALGFVGTKWVLQLDADEAFNRSDLAHLPSLLINSKFDAFALKITNLANNENFDGASIHRAIRLFRTSLFRYEGIIHEEPRPRSSRVRWTWATCDLQIIHWGYIGGHSKAKSERNCKLLEKALAEDPKICDLHYHLGVEYMASDRHEEAIESLRRATKLCPNKARGHLALFALRIGESLMKLGRIKQACNHVEKALESFSDYPDLLFLAGEINLKEERWEQALVWFERGAGITEASPEYWMSAEGLNQGAKQKVRICRSHLKSKQRQA